MICRSVGSAIVGLSVIFLKKGGKVHIYVPVAELVSSCNVILVLLRITKNWELMVRTITPGVQHVGTGAETGM